MSDWQLASEQERAIVTVARCGLELRLAQEGARRAGEALRRAIRSVEQAEVSMGDARRRLYRMDMSLKAVS